EHVDWLRSRLEEMRGGNPDANVEPALVACVEETMHAGSCEEFIATAYLELKQSLLACYRDHLAACDASANAAEARLLRRMIADLERHVEWAESPAQSPSPGIPGEGGGEGLPTASPIDRSSRFPSNPHPNPLPAYRERGNERQRICDLIAFGGGISGLENRP